MRYFTKILARIALALTALLSSLSAFGEQKKLTKLELYASPVFSSNIIMRHWWRPIRKHLQRETGIDVKIQKAATYTHYFERLDQNQTQLVLSPGHLVNYLYRYHKVEPLVGSQMRVITGLMYSKEMDFNFPDSVRGKCIATASPYSLSAHIGRHVFDQNDLPHKQLKYHTGFDTAIFTLLKKQCRFVLAPKAVFDAISTPLQSFYSFKVLHTLENGGLELGISQQFAQQHPKISQKIKTALLNFGRTEQTKQLLDTSGYSYFHPFRASSHPLMQFNPFTNPATSKLLTR